MQFEVVHSKKQIPVGHICIFKKLKLCFTVPVLTDCFELIELSLDELISDFSQSWEVWDFFLEHNDYQSSL